MSASLLGLITALIGLVPEFRDLLTNLYRGDQTVRDQVLAVLGNSDQELKDAIATAKATTSS